MSDLLDNTNSLYFIEGGGEMGEMIRSKNWNETPLGDPELWNPVLKNAISIILNNPFGMYIAWGSDYTQIYNDGYRPILGSIKHPAALGISTRETFAEIWSTIGDMFGDVMKGKSVGFRDFMLPLNRNGYVEECYFDFAYSPIRLENNEVGGVFVTMSETTSKRKSEIALQRGEERFRNMADNIPNLAWMANADGYIYWYNKKWYEYTGKTAEEMEGWGWQSVHNPDILPTVMNKWTNAIANGEEFEMEFPLKGANDKYCNFLTRVQPFRNSEGKIHQWFGTNTDITKRIEIEEALKESEERFRTMAESSGILIAMSDESSNAIYFNNAWISITGRTQEQLINYGWEDLLHPDERKDFINLYLNSFQNKVNFTTELRLLNKENNYIYLFLTSSPRFTPNGTFAGFISTCTEITERIKAEQALVKNEENLRNTILHAPVAMCIIKGPTYVVELVNEKMIEIWGRPAKDVLNKPIFESLPEVKDQGFDKLLHGVYTTGETFSANGLPASLIRNNKLENIFLNFVYEPYREGDGRITGVLAVAVDVTSEILAKNKIEEIVNKRTKELAEANENLRKSNDELAQFAYVASHDLQEPLRKITTFSNLLENNLGEIIDDKSKNYLDKINGSTKRMSTLIKDVLTYSALIKDSKVLRNVDLNQIVRHVLGDYDLLIGQKNAQITVESLPEIEAIPIQMEQLFGNIVGNSLKFTRDKIRPEIKIKAMKLNVDEIKKLGLNFLTEYYTIQIIDNGIGFKHENSIQIFDIFKRLHRTPNYQGTGIGLAMCKKIVLNHNGEINALGSSENGAVFNIILPKKQIN